MLNRRELLVAGAAAAAALGLPTRARADDWMGGIDFTGLGPGEGWPGWLCPGVANLIRGDGKGFLQAGSDVFPSDPRPVAFALDRRFRDAEIAAQLVASGAGAGLVLRRTGPRDYYAAIYDDEQGALLLIRRSPEGATELARTAAQRTDTLWFSAKGANPTTLTATFGGAGVTAQDAAPALQSPGDPGALATARTLFPHAGPPGLPALGNTRLLPYGVQEGQAFIGTPLGQAIIDAIRERSTAAFSSIAIRGTGRPAPTRPSVIAATSGRPIATGAELRVATDVPARVEIEIARDLDFRRSRRVKAGITGDFQSVFATVEGLPRGSRAYWRPLVRRNRRTTVGPARSFRTLPKTGRTTIAVGSCAAQFGPIFDLIAERRPDVLIWQGDLNYPDTNGPLAQTVPGYAGLWRDFLANPKLASILDRTLFATQRDDHDYGLQDANRTNLVPHGLAPWEALMERRAYYRFPAGQAHVWVLDQRLHKTDPAAPDTPDKTLLGIEQREWLLRSYATSTARFRIVCSPCTLAPLPANARDGSWAAGFTAERDLLTAKLRDAIWVTGDTHWSMVYDRDGLFEARPCPLGIPTPNDITLTQPNAAEEARRMPGVAYADDEHGHVALLTVGAGKLELELMREDGVVAFRREF